MKSFIGRHGRTLGIFLLCNAFILATSRSASSGVITFVPRTNLSDVVGTEKRKSIVRRSVFEDTPQPSSVSVRGGSLLLPQVNESAGAIIFILLDHLFRQIFKANGISFPSQLGGCCILFVLLILADLLKPGAGDVVFKALSPGAGILAKWLPVFFVPGLAMLPLAPSMGSTFEIMKVLAVVILGFYFTVMTTSFSVLTLRKIQGAVIDPATAAPQQAIADEQVCLEEKQVAPSPSPKAFSDDLMDVLAKGLVLTAAASIGAIRTDNKFATPLRTIFMLFTTFSGYVWGARLPSAFTKIVHPLVTSTVVTLLLTTLTSLATNASFSDVLQTYKRGSLKPMSTGAGDILLYLLGPSVVSFAIAMYSRKQVMVDNLLVVCTSMIIASVGGLFGTAAFVRLIQVGGGAGRILRLSLLPRNVTTPLAIAITNILGGDISLAAAVVVLTGIFGATFGARILTAMGVNDPVSRGLGIGAAAQGLGVASFAGETEAFPFAAISMVLTAVAATALVSIPALKESIIKLATGGTMA